jgi:hypothetical protein
MIKFIRSILSKLTFGKHSVFEGSGRVDETITGVMAQHYGFASVPPKGVELYTLQFGNNNISVAENDGTGKTTVPGPKTPGTVVIYTPSQDNGGKQLSIGCTPADPAISGDKPSIALFAAGDGIIVLQADLIKLSGTTLISLGEGTGQLALLNSNGFTDINTALGQIALYINGIIPGTVTWPGPSIIAQTHLTTKTVAK